MWHLSWCHIYRNRLLSPCCLPWHTLKLLALSVSKNSVAVKQILPLNSKYATYCFKDIVFLKLFKLKQKNIINKEYSQSAQLWKNITSDLQEIIMGTISFIQFSIRIINKWHILDILTPNTADISIFQWFNSNTMLYVYDKYCFIVIVCLYLLLNCGTSGQIITSGRSSVQHASELCLAS